MRMNIITAHGKNEDGLKVLLRAAAVHPGAYGGYTLEECPADDDAFVFTGVGGSPAHSFALRVKGDAIWTSDHGFRFACNILLAERIHFDWEERDYEDPKAIREAFRAAA